MCLTVKDPIWVLWGFHVRIVCSLSFLSFSDFYFVFRPFLHSLRLFFFFCNDCLAKEVWVKTYQLEQTPKNVWEVARYDVDCVELAAVFFVSCHPGKIPFLTPPELMDIHSKHSVAFLLPHFEICSESHQIKVLCKISFDVLFVHLFQNQFEIVGHWYIFKWYVKELLFLIETPLCFQAQLSSIQMCFQKNPTTCFS